MGARFRFRCGGHTRDARELLLARRMRRDTFHTDTQKSTAQASATPPQPPQPPSAPPPARTYPTALIATAAPSGKVDYITALNERVRQGVTPENNSALLFLQAMGPDAIFPETRQQYLQVLGVGSPATQGPFFVDYSHVREDASGWRSARGHCRRVRTMINS